MIGINTRLKNYICLDRDGTIIKHVHHLSNIQQVEFLPGVFEGCRLLKSKGYKFGVFTNQSVINRGKCTLAEIDTIHDLIRSEFVKNGLSLDFIYTCPHLPEDGCACRKPSTEMGLNAAKKYRINLTESFMIGDNLSDIEFGQKLGMKTVHISSYPYTKATITEADFFSAAKCILDLREPRCFRK